MKYLLFLGSILFCTSVNAQLIIGLGGQMGFPAGDWSDIANPGFGGTLEANYFLTDDLSLGIEGGFISFDSDLGALGDGYFDVNPFCIKAEYYFKGPEDALRPFVGLGIGSYFGNALTAIDGRILGPRTIEADLAGAGLSPRAGIDYEVIDRLSIVFQAQFHTLLYQEIGGVELDERTHYFALRLGIRYAVLN